MTDSDEPPEPESESNVSDSESSASVSVATTDLSLEDTSSSPPEPPPPPPPATTSSRRGRGNNRFPSRSRRSSTTSTTTTTTAAPTPTVTTTTTGKRKKKSSSSHKAADEDEEEEEYHPPPGSSSISGGGIGSRRSIQRGRIGKRTGGRPKKNSSNNIDDSKDTTNLIPSITTERHQQEEEEEEENDKKKKSGKKEEDDEFVLEDRHRSISPPIPTQSKSKAKKVSKKKGRPKKSSSTVVSAATNDHMDTTTASTTTNPTTTSSSSSSNNLPLILTGDKRRGLYECDYCRRDITQIPRIRCAVCPDFDLCLDCFATTDPTAGRTSRPVTPSVLSDITTTKSAKEDVDGGGDTAAGVGVREGEHHKVSHSSGGHEASHGYRVTDSTRYPIFAVTSLVERERNSESMEDGVDSNHEHSDNEGTINNNTNNSGQTTLDKYSNFGKNQWTAEEDLRLLDAITTWGLGNWTDISEAVGSNKSARRCMERYFDDYLGRYGHILPPYLLVDTSATNDKEDNHDNDDHDDKKEETKNQDKSKDEESSPPTKKKKRTLSSQTSDISTTPSSSPSTQQSSTKKQRTIIPTNTLPSYNTIWSSPYIPPMNPPLKHSQSVNRDIAYRNEQSAVKALLSATSKAEADAITQTYKNNGGVIPPRMEDIRTMAGSELAGFMPRRQDFDVEHDNEAEQILADMEFTPQDHPSERSLKISIIQIYNSKLDERDTRKKFLMERELLNYRKVQMEDMKRPKDERDLIQRMRLFARFHTPKEHEVFCNTLIQAKRLRKDIAQLQRYRRMGMRSLAEAEKYELDKGRRECHKLAHKQKQKEEVLNGGKKIEIAGGAAGGGTSVSGGGVGAGAGSGSGSGKVVPEGNANTPSATANTNIGGGGGGGGVEEKKAENPAATAAAAGDIISGEPYKPNVSDLLSPPHSKNTPGKKGKDNTTTTTKEQENTNPTTTKEQQTQQSKTQAFNIEHLSGYTLLSKKEVLLCTSLKLLPSSYLQVKKALLKASLTGDLLTNKEENGKKTVFKLDVEKRNGVIDFVLRSGWIAAKPNYCA